MKRKILFLLIIILMSGIAGLLYLVIRPYMIPAIDYLKLKQSIGRSSQKLLLIGIEGLDWKLVKRFSTKGDIKVLPELMNKGSYGKISTFFKESEDASWTTVCTGYLPDHHGISRVKREDQRLATLEDNSSSWATGLSRKKWALWEIASHFSLDVTIVGWPVSWPADKVKGILVSDRLYLFNTDRNISGSSSLCYPPSMLERITPLIKYYRDSYPQLFSSYFNIDTQNLETYLQKTWENRGQPSPHKDLSRLDPLESIRESFSIDLLNYELLRWFLKKYGQTSLSACYIKAVDRVTHLLSRTAIRKFSYKNSKDDNKLDPGYLFLKKYYQYIDYLVGLIQDEIDPETIIFIVSNHGFNLKEGNHNNCPPGWFVIKGSGINKKKNIEGVGMTDIAPTVLYLLGLPLPGDMDGDIIYDAITLSYLEKHRVTYWSNLSTPGLPSTRNGKTLLTSN